MSLARIALVLMAGCTASAPVVDEASSSAAAEDVCNPAACQAPVQRVFDRDPCQHAADDRTDCRAVIHEADSNCMASCQPWAPETGPTAESCAACEDACRSTYGRPAAGAEPSRGYLCRFIVAEHPDRAACEGDFAEAEVECLANCRKNPINTWGEGWVPPPACAPASAPAPAPTPTPMPMPVEPIRSPRGQGGIFRCDGGCGSSCVADAAVAPNGRRLDIPGFCHADGMCWTGEASCTPAPVEPARDPRGRGGIIACDGGCGTACVADVAVAPNGQSLEIPGFCHADGKCWTGEAVCEAPPEEWW